ncbi:hypothetical protein FHX74_000426 [Friedmanniella endophytica]|uniref:Uncharacterized protein n=1 Tax=Microlunatus kandeliicorticis TaxID=1759536 RepID=A0A7W3IPG0_9ACTN|nr:hypothetical protein [Microlunatus kandeliicorticis]MBA8792832.1 hypothetical protein [Microlunatus kandeliicorticis]
MNAGLIVVDLLAPRGDDVVNLREDVLSLALDQRAFGPRRLLVAFGTEDGELTALAHARRTDPPDLGLEACLFEWATVDLRSRTAIALSDEPVVSDQPLRPIAERLALARGLAAGFGVHLVDWIACDDQSYRSFALSVGQPEEWWSRPEPWPERVAVPGTGRLSAMPGYADGPAHRHRAKRRPGGRAGRVGSAAGPRATRGQR